MDTNKSEQRPQTPSDIQSTADPSQFTFHLKPEEVEEVKAVVNQAVNDYPSPDDPTLLNDAPVIAHEFPKRLRLFLNDFVSQETYPGVVVIKGFPIDQAKIKLTPPHWNLNADAKDTLEEQSYLVLLGSLLGSIFGWSTQQDGKIINDILPIEANIQEQLGTGSEILLTWHTEDAFHPYRADFIGLFCLRNPDKVATTVSWLDIDKLSSEQRDILFDNRFRIRPDESHLTKNASQTSVEVQGDKVKRAFDRISEMNSDTKKVSVLFGDHDSPYLRLDPYFMDTLPEDPEAQTALKALENVIDSGLYDLVLEAGDVCFLDNFRVVHGRNPFKARFDGKDRWLKRVNVTRDLRKSKDFRDGALGRLIL